MRVNCSDVSRQRLVLAVELHLHEVIALFFSVPCFSLIIMFVGFFDIGAGMVGCLLRILLSNIPLYRYAVLTPVDVWVVSSLELLQLKLP